MKKFMLIALLLTAGFVVPSLSSCGSADLTLFNWGEYISMDALHRFEKEYGVKVKLRTFDSNELMLNKLENSNYDVIIPSDYAVEEMAVKDLIQPIDWNLIDFDPKTEMVPALYDALQELAKDHGTEKGFDMLKYSVPYTWGELGILYRTDKISKEEIERDGWEALRNPTNADGSKRTAVMYDTARDLYSIALIANGKSIVNVSSEDIDLASNWLLEQKKAFGDNIAYKTEEILDDMPALKYDICFSFSGDAAYSIANAVDPKTGKHDASLLDFYIPEMVEGGDTRTNIYCDAMVISKNCQNVDLAHKFISFMSQYEAAYENTLEIGYTSPVKKVYEDVTSSNSEYEEGEGSFKEIGLAYNLIGGDYNVFYRYDEELKKTLEEKWIVVKNTRN